jgi:hypothetical protein
VFIQKTIGMPFGGVDNLIGRQTLKACKGGQFAILVQALPDDPYDGHRLAQISPVIEGLSASRLTPHIKRRYGAAPLSNPDTLQLANEDRHGVHGSTI